jgi:16S rRNA (uracil1498-N3)-methyltransferase
MPVLRIFSNSSKEIGLRSPESIKPKGELKRFLVALSEPVIQCPVTVSINDVFIVHHLRTVMRAKPGERMIIVDSQCERAYEGILQAISKQDITLVLEKALPIEANALPPVTLAVALIKEQRWDLLLQKATELGVRAFQPLLSERTVIRLSDADISKKQERWQAVVRSAAEQSEGLFIPQMLQPMSVSQFCTNPPDGLRVLLAERGEERLPLKNFLSLLQPDQSVTFAIGPEGGWTEGELFAFVQAGFQAASLGRRIMRSETAAMTAMAAVVYEHGTTS